MSRVVHIFPRSPFLSFTARIFDEAAPGDNAFFVLGAEPDGAAFAVPAGVRCEWLHPDAAAAEMISAEVAESALAIFHSVGAYAARILAAAPRTTSRVWSGWGGDYYGNDASPLAGLLDPITARWQRRSVPVRSRAVKAVRSRWINRPLRAAAASSDAFSAPIPDDLGVFARRFPGFRGAYRQVNYASVEDTFSVGQPSTPGDDILVGNSASPAGNHLDVFQRILPLHSPGRRVVVPLSYGDPRYADAVVEAGHRLFGSDLAPLRDFMPLEEYQSVVGGCGTVVMGHRRQQAIGNVASALWWGARVLMDARSPLYGFLRRAGAEIDSLDDLVEGEPSAGASAPKLATNRRVLSEFWGRERVIANARSLVEWSDDRRSR